MYQPSHFVEQREEVLHGLIAAHALATLVTHDANGSLCADHIPLMKAPSIANEPLRLLGHVARANPLWQHDQNRRDEQCDHRGEVLAIFHGPQAYISPNWYPSKHEHGKAVPTWNYLVVHAHGRLIVHDDTAWLRAQVTQLTQQQETTQPRPWQVNEAPADYIDKMLQAIVGIELVVTRLEGKWKVSQNQPAANRAGVRAGLQMQPSPQSAMAAYIPPS